MADLDLTVDVKGADQAAAGLDKVGASAAKTGNTWDQLRRKMGSGEVLRNAAASAALLSVGAGNTTQKIAALGGALASIPGPVGLIASGVAVAATVLDVFTKNAEQAEKAAAELAATLANLGKEKQAAQLALAGRITGAALRVGGDARRFALAGGRRSEQEALQALSPGDPGAALRQATILAESGLSDEKRRKAVGVAQEAGNLGYQVDDDFVRRLAKSLAYESEAQAGIPMAVRNPRTDMVRGAESFTTGDAELIAEALGGKVLQSDVTRQARQGTSQEARTFADNLRRAEAPAVAEALGSAASALVGAQSASAREALTRATETNAAKTAELNATLEDLTAKLRQAQGTAPPAPRESAWETAGRALRGVRSSP